VRCFPKVGMLSGVFFTALGGVVRGGRIGLGAKMAERINAWNSSTARSDNLKWVSHPIKVVSSCASAI
jgi:hypothetical protein